VNGAGHWCLYKTLPRNFYHKAQADNPGPYGLKVETMVIKAGDREYGSIALYYNNSSL